MPNTPSLAVAETNVDDGATPSGLVPTPVTAEQPTLDLTAMWSTQDTGGALIAVCGFDGSGKTTQVEALARHLAERGRSVHLTRQPTTWYRQLPEVRSFLNDGGSPRQARRLALLAAADRLRHLDEEVLPRLRDGQTVITDRYVFSSIAYFLHRGVPADLLLEINAGIPRPVLSIYLDVPATDLMRRLSMRDGDGTKHEEQAEQRIESVRAQFLRMRHELCWLDGRRHRDDLSRTIAALTTTGTP